MSGNIALCRKLSEAVIRQIYQVANSGIKYNEFYVTLEAVMKVSTNCTIIMKLLK